MDDGVRPFLADAMKSVRLSGRGFSRTLRVAQTIADLEGADKISVRHVAESISYREEAAFGNYGWRK
jgi:magnesium chelatase family protein